MARVEMGGQRMSSGLGGICRLSAFLAAVALAPCGAIQAADVVSTWTGTIGYWTDANQWSSVPLYPDNGNGGYTFDAVVAIGTVTQDLPAGVTIQSLSLANGTITGSGGLTLTAGGVWTSGSMTGAGSTAVEANAVLTLGGAADKTLLERELTNRGTVAWTSGRLSVGSGATINNEANAVWDVQVDQMFFLNSGLPQTATFHNQGVFRKSAGAGAASFSGGVFDNTGTVEVLSGALYLSGGTSTGVLAAAPNATLGFGGGGGVSTFSITGGSCDLQGTLATVGGTLDLGIDVTTVGLLYQGTLLSKIILEPRERLAVSGSPGMG